MTIIKIGLEKERSTGSG